MLGLAYLPLSVFQDSISQLGHQRGLRTVPSLRLAWEAIHVPQFWQWWILLLGIPTDWHSSLQGYGHGVGGLAALHGRLGSRSRPVPWLWWTLSLCTNSPLPAYCPSAICFSQAQEFWTCWFEFISPELVDGIVLGWFIGGGVTWACPC